MGPDPAAVERLRALVGTADRAVEAHSAFRRARHDDSVADLDVADPGAHLDHLPHRGVPEDGRRDLEQLAPPVHAVGGAERGRTGSDQHAAGRGIEVIDVLDHEGLADRGQQRCSHGAVMLVVCVLV